MQTAPIHETPLRLYNEKDCRQVTSLSRAQRWRLSKAGKFPKPIQLTERRVAWIADEVDAWVQARVVERDTESV